MEKIIIYKYADLVTMAQAATNGKMPSAWLADMRTKIAGMLKERPAAYLSFGPWWWVVKYQLYGAGLNSGTMNPERQAAITTGSDILDMVGALAYHGWNIDQMRSGNVFSVDTESGDQVDYVLADEEMDALVFAPAR